MNWREELHKHILEEEKDFEMYSELAEQAEEDGYDRMAGIIRDIACDEQSHIDVIAHMMKDCLGVDAQ